MPNSVDILWPVLRGLALGIEIMFSSWVAWVLLIVIVLIKILPFMLERWRLGKAGMPEVDHMSGLEFEKFLQILFRQMGYGVERTPYVGDYGGDLVLVKPGERIVVQAKRWNRAVGVKAVQEVAAARPKYGCDRALVVSNGDFTRAARELAKANRVELWGRSKLAEVILSLRASPKQALAEEGSLPASLEVAASGRSDPPESPGESEILVAPRCQKCGRVMVLRQSVHGKFWGCPGFPKCRYIVPIDCK